MHSLIFLKNGEEAKKFKGKIDSINYDKEIRSVSESVIKEAQKKISSQISSCDNKLTVRDAENICQVFGKFSEGLEAEVQVRLEDIITNHVNKNAQDLLSQYKDKIKDLAQDIEVGGIEVNAFELLDGEISSSININNLVSGLTRTERVKVGEEWVSNSSKKWYKPWTWLQESGHYKDIYENKEYVDGSQLAQKFFAPIQKNLYDNGDAAVKYAKEQATRIKESFNNKFIELDNILNIKLSELELYATDSKNIEKIIEDINKKLKWLEEIQYRIQDILSI